jgi:phosphate transport system protein
MVAVRSAFERQLRQLETELLRLAEYVETQLIEAVRTLHTRDFEAAQRIDSFDATLNKLRYEVEEQAYTLLALQQPNAGDMRRIVASVSIATNLERMGDHAAGIARLILRSVEAPRSIELPAFEHMARLATESLREAMVALSSGDAALARRVVSRDREIDHLHKEAYDYLIQVMINDRRMIEYATTLLWVSHNIERFADRISNICERIVYMFTGNLYEQRTDTIDIIRDRVK